MSSNTLNYPLLAIPAYYIFATLPHGYSSYLLNSAGYKINNANPKASMSPANVKGKVPDAIFHKYQRAENAQSNNIEQMPMFFAAILASIMAEKATLTGLGQTATGTDPTGVRAFIGAWFVVRAAYTVLYIQTTSHNASFMRSASYMVGVGLTVYQIYKAALLLG